MTKKKLDDRIDIIINDLDCDSTKLEDIKFEVQGLQEQIDELQLLKKELDKENKMLKKQVQKLKCEGK